MTGRGDGLPDWDVPAAPVRRPPPVIAVPATARRDLRGRRVLVGLPGLGWRADLRADSIVVQGSRSYVPVLTEHEWYRAEEENIEVFAPLVPVDRVWVETIGDAPAEAPRRDLVGRLVSLDEPPVRYPVPAREVAGLTGRRVVVVSGSPDDPAADRRDLRAITEPYSSVDGDICVRVAAEVDWYRWAWSGRMPRTTAEPVHLLWVE